MPASRPTVSLDERASGLLLHPTSLPGPHGCGDLGRPAHTFATWLADAKQRLWQMLPVGPVGYGNSPYSALSAFAGNPLLVSLEDLEEAGLLDPTPPPRLPRGRVAYGPTEAYRKQRLQEAHQRWSAGGDRADFEAFLQRERGWLEDFTLFRAIKDTQGQRQWSLWPAPLRDRDPKAMAEAKAALAEPIEQAAFEQWLFHEQWARLRAHCHSLGIALIGDIPIFVAHDSADVWANRRLFDLNPDGSLRVVAGVPPDYFSATGQRWGNPLYRWDEIEREDFSFWIERIRHAIERFDLVRLDHFVGFVRYWEIPAEEETAINGVWRPSPGARLLERAGEVLGLDRLPFIAEDLGAVTKEVTDLRVRLGLPGTKVLQFAFGDDPQAPSFLPYNYPRLSVVYTGTHDNDTAVGWFRDQGDLPGARAPEQIEKEREFALRYLGATATDVHWDMIRAAMGSVANFSIFPMQDVLGLGSEARMNRPGVPEGNWEWRLRSLPQGAAAELALLTETFGRGGPDR